MVYSAAEARDYLSYIRINMITIARVHFYLFIYFLFVCLFVRTSVEEAKVSNL